VRRTKSQDTGLSQLLPLHNYSRLVSCGRRRGEGGKKEREGGREKGVPMRYHGLDSRLLQKKKKSLIPIFLY